MDGVARIIGGVVVNVEAAEPEWLRAAQLTKADHELLVEYTDDAPAHIGLRYDPERGFEQPARLVYVEDVYPLEVVTDENGDPTYHPSEWRQPEGNSE